jgi:hypothetical protein
MYLNSKDSNKTLEIKHSIKGRGNLFEPVISSIYSTSKRQNPITNLEI